MEAEVKTVVRPDTGKPKHKGGRPKINIRREVQVKVRLTATEHFMIGARAKEAGMRISDWFRAAAKAARVIARLKPEDLQIMRMLTGMANNLNQLTKLAHRDGLLTVARKCDGLMIEIDQALKYFNSDDRKDT
ncbi:plasmid mobilization relaxosome protein MobC [soil metagenome]